MKRWLALVVLVTALTMGLASASGQSQGLSVRVFAVNQIPPSRDDTVYDDCGSLVVDNVFQSWGGGVVADCAYDRVMLHYSGTIHVPADARFLLFSDDGGWAQIGEQEFGYWGDRSCQATVSQFVVSAGSYQFEDWYYENGGGTCNYLYWSLDNGPWQVVPASAFFIEEPTTTTEEPTTTTQIPTTTTTSSSTTTTTVAVATSTTSPVVQTLPSSTETSTSSLPPSTTTTVDTTVPETSTTSTTSTTTTSSSTSTSTTQVPVAQSTTTVAPTTTVSPTTQPVQDVVQNPSLIATLSVDQANAVFDAIDEGSLTDEQGEALVEAVQNAPTEIRKSFESKVNIFGGHTDNYVPLGSRVTVRQRRIIIAVGLVTASASLMPRRRND